MRPFRWDQRWSILAGVALVALYACLPKGRPVPSGISIVSVAGLEDATRADPFVVYRGTAEGYHRFSAIDGRAFAVPVGQVEVSTPFSPSDGLTLCFHPRRQGRSTLRRGSSNGPECTAPRQRPSLLAAILQARNGWWAEPTPRRQNLATRRQPGRFSSPAGCKKASLSRL